MKPHPSQRDLFGPAPPTPSPLVSKPPAAAQAIHWAVATTQRAMTACGIELIEFFHHERPRRALTKGTAIRITVSLDRFDPSINCEGCKERFR